VRFIGVQTVARGVWFPACVRSPRFRGQNHRETEQNTLVVA